MAFYGGQYQSTLYSVIPGTNEESDKSKRILNFNDEIIDGSPVIIQASGLFLINASGNYLVSWFITLKTGLGEHGVCFSLIAEILNAQGVVEESRKIRSTNHMKTGQFSGSALLQLEEGQTCRLGLYNEGEYTAVLSDATPINANILIHPYVTGSYSSSYGLIGLDLQLDNTLDNTLAYQQPIVFTKKNNTAPKVFDCDLTTGVITIKSGGNFMLFFNVNIDGSTDASSISFSLCSNNTPVSTFHNTLLLQNSFSGYFFFTATANQTFTITNTSKNSNQKGADLTYSNVPLRASVSILGHS